MSRDYDLQVGKVMKILDIRGEMVVKKIATDIWAGITRRNPVDTGYSRAAWNIGIDKPNDSTPGKYDKNIQVPPPDQGRKTEPLNHAKLLDQQTFITNAVEYVPYLEGGSSQQAPAGMVLVTVEAVVTELNQFIEQAVAANPL